AVHMMMRRLENARCLSPTHIGFPHRLSPNVSERSPMVGPFAGCSKVGGGLPKCGGLSFATILGRVPRSGFARLCGAARSRREFRVTEAYHDMAVDHADRLHEGIDDGGSAEFKAAARELFRDLARELGLGRHLLDAAQAVDLRAAVD